jgi:hypothetical protein
MTSLQTAPRSCRSLLAGDCLPWHGRPAHGDAQGTPAKQSPASRLLQAGKGISFAPHLLAFVLATGALPELPAQAPASAAAEVSTAQSDEQKAALQALDSDIVRLDALLEKITDVPLNATTRGFIDVFKAKRDALRKSYDQTKYDELKFETVAEFQRLHLWLRSPRERPLDPANPARVVFSLEPSPADPAEVAAALAAADGEIARLAEQAGRLAAGPARAGGAQRLKAIKESRANLGRAFTTPGWYALIAALKAGVEPQ